MSGDGAYASSVSGDARSRERSASDGPLSVVIFVMCCAAALYWTWVNRNAGIINPERGVGYWLGIVGATLMLTLMLYPLRKRMKALRSMGSVAAWFRLHMVLGIVGPVLVIMHSNFETKSLNATVALYTMLVVSISGVVGRYIYGRIHRGLYGGRIEAREIIAEAQAFREGLGMGLHAAAWRAQQGDLEREATKQAHGFFSALAQAHTLNVHAASSERALLLDFEQELEARAYEEGWPADMRRRQLADGRARIRNYYAAIRRVGGLAINDRLFAAWHVLHFPLFLMLILTASIHIVAVHLY